MKTWLFLLAALLVITLVLFKSRERFQPEFLDKRQVARTVDVQDSSYAQQTNHMMPSAYASEPVQGMETPFQVNQYRAYVV